MAGVCALGCLGIASSNQENVLEGLLDYQSGQRFGIPMRIEASVTPDGATLIRNVTYTDPGNLVYVVNVVTITQEGLLDDNVDSLGYTSDVKWALVYSHEGADNDHPARIRHTIQRDGDDLTSSKEECFLSGEQSDGFSYEMVRN